MEEVLVLFSMKIKKYHGFTLIELLVVISIIGILIAISLAGFSRSRKSARDGKRKADLEQIRSALEIYRTDCKTYPADITFGGSLEGAGTSCSGVYMAKVPQDPLTGTYDYRYLFGSANSYALCAYLETVTATVTGCGGQCGTVVDCNYKVINP